MPEAPSRAYLGAYLGTATARDTIVACDGDSERVSLLGRPWALRDVDDVEAFARRIPEAKLQRRGAHLRPDLHDEAVCFLLEVAVKADRAYDATYGGSFEQYLGSKISLGVDFYRKELGRTRWQFRDSLHTRERPDLVSLDAESSEGELGDALIGSTGEFEAGRLDIERALAG
jgi:hypothetical protein